MKFFNILAAEKWGGGTPTTNFFDLLFAQSMGEKWQTYEGTLPATLNANGDDMRQYQVYGATGGVGTWDDTEQSYKLDMAVGSNILQSSEIEQGGYYASAGAIPEKIPNNRRCRSKNMYTISGEKLFYDFKSLNVNIAFVNSNGTSLGGSGFKSGVGSVDVLANAVKCFFIIANTNTDAGIIPAQVIAAGIWASVDATTTPIYIGDEPLEKDEYVDYGEQKVYRRTAQIMPSAPAETKTQNGITITCDGEGRYSISGRATRETSIQFDIPEFTIPVSSGQGGQGTMSLFNTAIPSSANNKIGFYYNSELIDAWSLTIPNRVSDSYVTMGNKKCNTIIINIAILKNVQCILLPMFTDNGALPETYTPYLQPTDPPVALPALPTCEGETIVDYTGSGTAPEKVYFEYQGGKQP